ncbi:MAG: efflux RND transporter permease subunit [Magnetococcales bacterium]|nr:efflux RND transporter permease subunit [Magnetococcales bacterium]
MTTPIPPAPRRYSGPIAWMAQNSVAANLAMWVILIGGVLGLFTTKQEVFPEFDTDFVQIVVPYPGAGPQEVEQGIILVVEEAVRSLDGIKRVISVAAEDAATILVELHLNTNQDRILAEINNEIDRIRTFPENAEQPEVQLLRNRREVISLVIAGERSRSELRTLAEQARDDLLASPDITQVELHGVRPLEIAVEIPRTRLEALGLTLDEVAQRIRLASLDLPAGGLDTSTGEVLVRMADRRGTGIQLGRIVLHSSAAGEIRHLEELATIRDGFAETDQSLFYNGLPAVRATVYRVGKERPIRVANAVKAYAQRLKNQLPADMRVETWRDDSVKLRARIDLLVRNAWIGLLLVLTILALFLDYRLAGWVALGIPISFMGAFLMMPEWDISINMVTLFAFIVTLGMVVDDAIVVGENIYQKMQEGEEPQQAAILGAREMSVPVTFSILTTVAAFFPLLLVPGVLGKIFRLIPAIVVMVLLFSLLESFLVLPAHLAHRRLEPPTTRIGRLLHAVQRFMGGALHRFTYTLYKPFLRVVLRWRYATLALALVSFIFSVLMVTTGRMAYSFFPKIEDDDVRVFVQMNYGAPVENTLAVMRRIEQAADEAARELGAEEVIRGRLSMVGESRNSGGGHGKRGSSTGSHLLDVEISLKDLDQGGIPASLFARTWSEKIPQMAGVESLVVQNTIGPSAGSPVDVRLSHRDGATLEAASRVLTARLMELPALVNVENDYAIGKPQLDLHLTPYGRTMGLDSDSVARQIRASLHGAEAFRDQRGRNEITVMVRLPLEERTSLSDLNALMIKTPQGGYLPLPAIATWETRVSPTSIRREDGRPIVNVKADLAPTSPDPRPVLETIRQEIFPDLKRQWPDLELIFVGEQREQKELFSGLGRNYLLAIFCIFTLIAIPFRSYSQPLIIMSVIPLGFVGAIMGHAVMGFGLSMVSLLGIVALSGVVVNDSLVLIHAVNHRRAEGADMITAIIDGSTRRLRPILLTSLTTFFGLAPMILETSLQARFLIPMAISLGFGVLFATVVVLIVVPALTLVLDDIHILLGVGKRREQSP